VVDKDTGKQPALQPENSATPDVFMRTRSRSGTIRPVNYRTLVQGQEKPKEHSAIVDSQSSSSSGEHAVQSFAADTPEEIAQQLAIQGQIQRDQQEQLRAQAQTIDTLKTMIQQVLERVSKKKSRHAGSTSHSKDRESSDSDSSIRFHSPHELDDKAEPPVKTDGQSKIEPENKATDSDAGHRMKRLEEQVAALKTTTIRQEAGATRPYPVEWDVVKYPSRFKVPTLNTFDGKGSAQQHIYYLQSHTGSLMGNDPVRTRLFISTLKGVAFEWFRKLPKGSITCWDDLEALFLSRFFEEEADINMHTLLLTKQKEGELVKDFIEHFRELAMKSRSGMTTETLVKTCRHNFLTPILVQMGVVECKTWKQLQEHGQTAQELVALVRAEEKNNRTPRGGGPPPRRNQDPPAKKETLAADTQQASSSRPTMGGFVDRFPVKYSFKDDKVEALFKMLIKGRQLKLPEPRKPEDVGKTDDPRYCLYHRALGHPTKSCWSLKDKLQVLVDAGALRLKTEQKTTTANMTSCIQFGQSSPTPTAVYPIQAVEMRVINSDPHRQQERGLVRMTIPGGGAMWLHPNLLNEVTPWTTASRKKSRGKTKQANVII